MRMCTTPSDDPLLQDAVVCRTAHGLHFLGGVGLRLRAIADEGDFTPVGPLAITRISPQLAKPQLAKRRRTIGPRRDLWPAASSTPPPVRELRVRRTRVSTFAHGSRSHPYRSPSRRLGHAHLEWDHELRVRRLQMIATLNTTPSSEAIARVSVTAPSTVTITLAARQPPRFGRDTLAQRPLTREE